MEANGRSEPTRGRPHRVAIVGAGFGGLFVAKALRRGDVNVLLGEVNAIDLDAGRLTADTLGLPGEVP